MNKVSRRWIFQVLGHSTSGISLAFRQQAVTAALGVGLILALPLSASTLEQPIGLDSSIGVLHQTVTTPSPVAQQFYNQGTAYLGSFHWQRAARSFRESLRLDPELAAARVGLARSFLALGALDEALDQAREAVGVAEQQDLPEVEAGWVQLGLEQMQLVDALAKGSATDSTAYRDAIDRYLERFPENREALVLRGNADQRPDGWGQSGSAGSIAWYEKAIALDPDHFPAHHFLAHSLEMLGRYREALDHARRYAELAPGAPHAQHMVAHFAPRMGEWEVARDRLEEADRLHRRDFAAGRLAPWEDWHFGHNLLLLATVHLRLGHLEKAEGVFRETFDLSYPGRRAGFYCSPWIEFLLSEARFPEALSAAEACSQRESQLARVLGHAYRGEALLGLERLEPARRALAKAKEEQQAFTATLGTAPEEGAFAFAAHLALSILEGKVLLREPEPSAGESLLRQIAEVLGRRGSVDGWAQGWVRIEGIVVDAQQAGQTELACSIRESAVGQMPPFRNSTGLCEPLTPEGSSNDTKKARTRSDDAFHLGFTEGSTSCHG